MKHRLFEMHLIEHQVEHIEQYQLHEAIELIYETI